MDKRITVVLADANEEFRTALKQALEATGEFDVVGCAADGLAAAQDIAERKPQLLVMDLLLPGLDGFGVLEQAAKDKVQMKTVVVSALYRDQIVSQAMSRGVSFFMPKPCELTSLLDQMRRAVNEGEESEDESQALEREVTAVIHEVGVPAHIKGYQYVREAIVIAVQDMDVIKGAFAAAGGTDNGYHLVLFKINADVLEHVELMKALAQVNDLKDLLICHDSSSFLPER